MITIEEIKEAPVSVEEFRDAYNTIKKHCEQCSGAEGCERCKMYGICYMECLPPKNWPDYDTIQYGKQSAAG